MLDQVRSQVERGVSAGPSSGSSVHGVSECGIHCEWRAMDTQDRKYSIVCNPNQPVYLNILSVSQRVYFFRDESSHRLCEEFSSNQPPNSYRITRSSTRTEAYTVNRQRTVESGYHM
jgi:hypothetical protein